MLRKVLLSAAAVSVIAGPIAFAQDVADSEPPAAAQAGDERPGFRGPLQRFDTNNDGTIQESEFTAAHAGRLAEADADGDAVLSQEELENYVMRREVERKARRAAMRLDIDGDGEVKIQEIEQHRAKLFALMDRDNDGSLTMEEMRRGTLVAHRGFGGHHRFKRGDHRGPHGFMMMKQGDMGSDMMSPGMMGPGGEAEGDEE